MFSNNRLWNTQNQYQNFDNHKRVLVCCSAGLLRSPSVANVLSQPPFNCNTRAVGLDCGYALICVDYILLEWADIIVVMEPDQKKQVGRLAEDVDVDISEKTLICLDIPDQFSYNDFQLIEMAKDKCMMHPELVCNQMVGGR